MTRESRQARDPRTIITPYAFEVAPEILDRPLANPWRRLGAMLVDLVLIGLLTTVGPILLGIAAAVAFFRIATRRSGKTLVSRVVRASFGCLGSVIVLSLATCLAAPLFWGGGEDIRRTGEEIRSRVEEEMEREGISVSAGEILQGFAEGARLREAGSQEEAMETGLALARRMRRAGLGRAEIRETLRSLVPPDSAAPWGRGVVDSVLARLDTVPERPGPVGDSAVIAYVAALQREDSAAVRRLRPRAREALAGEELADLRDRVATLEGRNERLGDEVDELEERLEAAEGGDYGSLAGLLWSELSEEVGLGMGWFGLYFTLFLAWWHGQTPGKRLLGIRVVQLDNSPLTLWESFERFGGYFAGVATGLFGFAQVFWDPNRQAIHDRIAGTVVVRLTGDDEVYGRRPDRDSSPGGEWSRRTSSYPEGDARRRPGGRDEGASGTGTSRRGRRPGSTPEEPDAGASADPPAKE